MRAAYRRSVDRRAGSAVGVGVMTLCLMGSLETRAQPIIEHHGYRCLPRDRYAQIAATISAESQVRAARVYFRSIQYSDFYFVTMEHVGDRFECSLPKPSRETDRVVYYVEAVDAAFNVSRTMEYVPEVTDASDCRRRDPAVAWFAGDSPDLIVGAVRSGLPPLPPGFEAGGISGFVSATGAITTTGGAGVGTAVALAAGAGAAAGVGVLVSGGRESPSPSGPVPAPMPSSTSTAPSQTSTTTTAVSPPSGSTTSTTVPPRSTTTVVPASTTTSSLEPLVACFTVSDLDGPSGCRVGFDAGCSQGDIETYTWRFIDNPPLTLTLPGPIAEHDWSADPACGTPFTRQVELTIRAADGTTRTLKRNINPTSPNGLRALPQFEAGGVSTAFTSELRGGEPGSPVRGQIRVNDRDAGSTDNRRPFQHVFSGRMGVNQVDAHLITASPVPLLWRFDFSTTEGFVTGSLQVQAGAVVARDGRSLVFRPSGVPGEPLRFTFLIR